MNMFKKKLITAIAVLITAILIYGCLEEVIPPPFTGELNVTA